MCTCIRLGLGINVFMYQARTGYQCIHVSGYVWVSMYTCIRLGYQCIHVSGLGINVYMYQVMFGYQCIRVSG